MREFYPKQGRVILHVDMNSFYASVEAAHDPQLKGKPLAIAGNPKERRGIIITCSYEARAFGVRTTMPLWEAQQLCPHLTVKRPNFDLYRQASYELFQLLSQFTEIIQPVSIDEGYLDITHCHEAGAPIHIAEMIQREVLEQLGLPCSIGIAPNKFLAKMASNMQKPMGITVLRKRDVPAVLWSRDVQDMHGVGKKTAEKLKELRIVTIGDLAAAQEGELKEMLGINGPVLKQKANGEDDRPVDPAAMAQFKTIGNSTTLPKDTIEETILYGVLERLSASVSRRLKKRNLVTYNVQIMIQYANRTITTRSKQLKNAVAEEKDVFQAASRLWKQHWDGDEVRLLGVTACDIEEKSASVKQLDLFSFQEDAKEEPLLHVMEQLKDRYGEGVIRIGGDIHKEKKQSLHDMLTKKYS